MTLRHLVMWTLHDAADGPRFKAELDSCRGLVPGMLAFDVALRTAGLEANVDVLLDSSFADAAALAAYQNHPHHKAVGARIGPLRASRHVMDYDTDSFKETAL
ncbi:MAG: Dabb family protein [Rubrivivax sp.]|nr:Dabb family protein [Rubrivivax sp.]